MGTCILCGAKTPSGIVCADRRLCAFRWAARYRMEMKIHSEAQDRKITDLSAA